jgi:hypothetical protein
MAPPQFSGLVAYGPKGEEQIRRHQLWEQNLPRAEEAAKELSAEQNRRYLADITRSESEARIQAERDRDKATAAHQLADDQLNQAKVRLEYQDPTKTGGKIAYTPEAAEQLASMNHIWQETVPPSFAGKDERWFSPVENTVTAEMAASPIGRRMGWQEGQHLNGEAYRAAVTGNFEAILHGGGPGDPMEVKNAIFGSIPAKYQDLRDSTWAQAQFYLNDKSGDKLKNAEAARQVMEKGFQLSEERLRQERQQQFEKEKEAANRGALGKDPNTGLITWTPVGQRQTPGTMTVGQAGQIAQQAAKDVGNAVKSAEDMQESAKNAAGLVAMANNGNPMADRTLLFQFLGATKPEGMGKLRLSNQEINFVLSARSALGDLDALWNKISSGGNLATKERQDILDIMNYMAARAAEHAKEKQAAAPGGRGVTTTPITPPSSTPATPPSAEDVKKKHNINY